MRLEPTFLLLVTLQALHSAEEYTHRLYDVFPPARLVSSLFSDDLLGERYEGEVRSLRTRHFVGVYAGSLTLGIGGALLVHRLYGIDSLRVVLIYCGSLFLLAATRRPGWLYATFRRLGWFAAISSDAAMRTLFASLGVLQLVAGLLGGTP